MGSPPTESPRLISMHLELAPVAKSSPRALVVNGQGRMYTSAKSRGYMKSVADQVQDCLPSDWRPLDKPIAVMVTFYLAEPKTRRRVFPSVRPDVDNYLKALFDGMTQAGIWVDDSIVCDIVASKRYGVPGISISIAELESK